MSALHPLQFNIQDFSPFQRVFEIGRGARLPDLVVQLLDGKDPVDLSGAGVTFSMVRDDASTFISSVSGDVVDGPTGKIRYQWQTGDTDVSAFYDAQFVVTVAGESYKIPTNGNQKLRIVIPDDVLVGAGPAQPPLFGNIFVHQQTTAATTWTITHNLAKFPSLVIVDDNDKIIGGVVTHLSNLQVQVEFSEALTGKVYFN